MSENRVIGRQGALPWRLSADLRRFKRLTMGHHLIMGRKTFESIGRPLPGRTSIVLTRQNAYHAGGVLTAAGLPEALRLAAGDDEVFIIGGAQIYEIALPRAERIYLTDVHAQVQGDTVFPDFSEDEWSVVDQEHHVSDDRNAFDYSFRILDRQKPEAQ
jgi:dihydrofolate reductase